MWPSLNIRILLGLWAMGFLSASAQTFRPVPVDTRALMLNSDAETVLKIFPESTPALSDSLITMQPYWYYTYSSHIKLRRGQNSLLGDSLRLLADGRYTSKVQGNYWCFWDFDASLSSFQLYSDSLYQATATVFETGHYTMFGSITAIRKYRINSNMPGWPPLMEIWISADYGVVRSHYFFLLTSMIPAFNQPINLAGIQIGNTHFGHTDPVATVYSPGDVLGYVRSTESRSSPRSFRYRRITLLTELSRSGPHQQWQCVLQVFSMDNLFQELSHDTVNMNLPVVVSDSMGLVTVFWDGSPSTNGRLYSRLPGTPESLKGGYFIHGVDSFSRTVCEGTIGGSSYHEVLTASKGKVYSISKSAERNSCSNITIDNLVYSFLNGVHEGQEPSLQTVSVAEMGSEIQNVKVYPNPFSTELHVDLEGAGSAQYVIAALHGQVCMQGSVDFSGHSPSILPTATLKPGLYLFYLQFDGQFSKPLKLVKY